MKDNTKIKSVPSLERLKANSNWAGQRVLFVTWLFGKEYYWMRDVDGTHYLAKVGHDGLPDLSPV